MQPTMHPSFRQTLEKWATTLVGGAVVVFAVALVAKTFQPPKAIGKDPHEHEPAAGGNVSGAGDAGAAGASAGGPVASDAGAPLLLSDLLQNEPRTDGGDGATLPDGAPVPPLPFNAPRQVRFGVVLVSYEGSQSSPTLAHGATRSKAEAKLLASRLAETARQDFHAAVQQGDPGSADDVGRVKQGILEPAPEYVLFTLPIDGVGGPVSTPRGYFIVKRLE